ncbi:MAG TPA: deoxyhypusine synthase family protein [Vicinamibacteria bacterium]|nr:deoxyhypusine synthase family protein [Vicinamibacteria bacterium]
MDKGPVSQFIQRNFRHFNAATLVDAAIGYEKVIDEGGRMMITLAGAMSTGELGLSLAEMIRRDKVHIICCTGANLEEDLFNLVAHDHYKRIPNYRDLSPDDERMLLEGHYNRVTDTCIPEEEAMRRIEHHISQLWSEARQRGKRHFPHEYLYDLISRGKLENHYQIDPKDSWIVAACERNLPILVPGWEDSTLGNIFAAHCILGDTDPTVLRSGIEYMIDFADWYTKQSRAGGVGFFQIGGGIAGDFPICVVPMLHQDLRRENVPRWCYFCQISDSTTSYGGYSGAVPNEKITWGKLSVDCPKYVIESDASIVAPLVFGWILGW